jgi:hypothetical protein
MSWDLSASIAPSFTARVTIGLPSAFETTAADDSVTVILPDEAFWSRDAGRQKMAGRQDEHARHQRTLEADTARYESALRLLEGVRRWQADIGPGAQTAAEERLTTAQVAARGIPEARNSLTRQQEELTGERNGAEEAERTFRQQAASARARVERLHILEKQTAPREELQQRIASLRADIDARKADREKAREGKGNARTRRDTASTTAARLATTLAEMNPVRADAESFTVLVTHADDPVSPEDSQADRALLAERTRSLVDRWRGLATDQVLQGELDQVQRQLRDAGEKLAANHEQSAVASARALAAEAHLEQHLIGAQLARPGQLKELNRSRVPTYPRRSHAAPSGSRLYHDCAPAGRTRGQDISVLGGTPSRPGGRPVVFTGAKGRP